MAFLRDRSHVVVSQLVRANEREVENNAGGYVYAVDDWARLDRWLVLGSAGGTYYVSQDALTDDNTRVLKGLLAVDGPRVVGSVVEISKAACAVKQDYGLYALALAAASEGVATRQAAYNAVPDVCRTASTLFQFVSYLKGRRGWSRGLRTAVARWYERWDAEQLAYQMVKYPQRHGFSHRDLLRLAHPAPRALYRWAVGKDVSIEELPEIVRLADEAKLADVERRRTFARVLPREALPTEWLTDPNVWEGLLYGRDGHGMPLTALLRNLGNLSKCGLLVAHSDASRHVCELLTSEDRIRRARIHPMSIFLAGKTYASGRGVRGAGTWAPVGAVADALDDAFYLAFGNVEPTGRKMLVAIDSSGSMSSPVLGYANVSARAASLAFGLVVMRTEPQARILGFTDGSNTTEFHIGGDERLRDFEHRFNERVEGRGTDCAIPFTWAAQKGYDPDAVLLWTDNETWAGNIHVDQALQALRRKVRKPVKAVIAATVSTAFSAGDPNDPDVLQICGFDASVPSVVADFVRGEVETTA